MATVAEKMAEALEALHRLREENKCVVLQGTNQISRTYLNRLLDNGWLQEVMRGWYISARPGSEGDTTVWYTSYWYFIAKYATTRFGDAWCLSPEHSLDIHSGKTTVPTQLILRSPDANNNIAKLMYETSLFDLKADIPEMIHKDSQYGLNMYTLEEALVYVSPQYYQTEKIAIRTCLAMIQDASGILKVLLRNGVSVRAGRIAGAFRNLGNNVIADTILSYMKRLGYDVREEDPFEDKSDQPIEFQKSPYVTRIKLMWETMRQTVIDNFPELPIPVMDIGQFLEKVGSKYTEDAYHSLSIEGYQVSTELIEKVRAGNWEPNSNESDHDQRNALVARGYYQAFQVVKQTIKDILNGKNPGEAVRDSHGEWYLEMWQPFVMVNLFEPSALAGYRTEQVYIRGSQHIPLNPQAVRDAMPTLFELLQSEPHAGVRAVLGHFIFVYIHPYMDGNGRMGRFLMNTMLASGGYNWLVVPVNKRQEYMQALEKTSVQGDITDFTKIIVSLLDKNKDMDSSTNKPFEYTDEWWDSAWGENLPTVVNENVFLGKPHRKMRGRIVNVEYDATPVSRTVSGISKKNQGSYGDGYTSWGSNGTYSLGQEIVRNLNVKICIYDFDAKGNNTVTLDIRDFVLANFNRIRMSDNLEAQIKEKLEGQKVTVYQVPVPYGFHLIEEEIRKFLA